ncbi:DUF2924 domain-containing protein [Dokdonella sp.]|uniref:DUF2924 domain-containing protein n=1 Tax=Dokdonella sp. TaxID=2291710 RepID=UPI0025B86304|nr:DUF2924 domain-containing protein [Dokdonella sp.]MBX3692677.1 DUF2924 domain-containing protein [Dokdonella sp.]MCW5567512.1 DUF2924 domain-containing protein [Dokdonella sp.]
MSNPTITAPTLAARLAALPTMPMERLWQLWDEHFPRRPQKVTRRTLEARLAHRLQEVELGGLPQKIKDHLADVGERHSKIKVGRVPDRNVKRSLGKRLMPGTTLIREWEGQEFRVTVASDGFYLFNGQRFKSLSGVARSITGTNWSGPRFFGVEDGGR